MIAQISDALYLQMYDTNHLHCPCTYHSNFLSSFLYKLGTISGTKYSSHWPFSCIGVIGILEGYKTWQVITYVTVEHATQCTKYFLFVQFFHENMINTGRRKLGDTSRQRYITQIPIWHHCGHVRCYTFISVFYKINIHVSSQNDVFLSFHREPYYYDNLRNMSLIQPLFCKFERGYQGSKWVWIIHILYFFVNHRLCRYWSIKM